MLKTILKIAAYGVGGLLLLVVLLGIFLVTPPGEGVLKGIAEAQAGDALGVEISIGNLATNLFGYVALDSVVVKPTGSLDTSLFAARLRVNFQLLPMLGGQFVLDSVYISDVTTAVTRTADGDLRLPVNLPPATEEAPESTSEVVAAEPVFFLNTAIGERIRVRYTDASVPLVTTVQQLDFVASMADGRTTTFDVNASPIVTQLDSVALPAFRLTMRGQVDSATLLLDTLALDSDSLTLTVIGRIPFDSAASMQAEVAVEGNPNPLISPAAAVYGFHTVRTSDDLSLRASAAGTILAPELTTRLTLSKVEAYETTVHDALLVARLVGSEVSVDTLRAGILNGRLLAEATVDLDSIWESTAEAELRDIDIGSLYTMLTSEPSPYTGKLSGDLSIAELDSAFVNWRTSANLTGTELTYENKELPDLTADLSFQAERLKLAIDQDDLHILANGTFGADSVDATFDLTVPSLAPFAALADLETVQGGIAAKGSMRGAMANPSLVAELSGRQLRYENIPIDTLQASVRYSDSLLTIDTAYVFAAENSIDLLQSPFGLDSISGHYGFEAAGAGTLENLRGKTSVTLRDFAFRGYELDSAALLVSIEGRTALVDSTRLYLDSLAARIDGRVQIDSLAGQLTLALTDYARPDTSETDTVTGPIDAGEIRAEFVYSDSAASSANVTGRDLRLTTLARLGQSEQPIDGRLAFTLNANGTLTEPRADFASTISAITLGGVSLDSIVTRVRLRDTSVTIDTLHGHGLGQRLTVSGALELGRDSSGALAFPDDAVVRGAIRSDSIDLRLFEVMLSEGMTLAGRASLDMSWDGTMTDPNLRGQVDVRDVNFVPQPALDSITGFNLRMLTRDTDFTIDTGYGAYNNMPFTLKGTASLVEFEKLRTDLRLVSQGFGSLQVRGTMSADELDMDVRIDTLMLGLFEPFVAMVDTLDGTLSCDLTLRGSFEDPEINGRLMSRDLKVKPALMDSTIHGGVVVMTFEGNRVTVDSVYAAVGPGWLLINGTFMVDDQAVSDIDLALTARSVTFSAEDLCIVTIDSSHLTFRTTTEGYRLAGRLELGDSRLTANFPWSSVLPWVVSVEEVPPDYPEMLRQTALDIQVRESKKLWVDNNLARIRMHAALAIVGSVARPTLSGQITVEEGYILYLDRKFDVKTGMVLMSNPNRFNPEVNFSAEAKVTNYQGITPTTYTITTSATGPMDQLRTSLTSNPPLSEPDVVSLLTLGATREQLTGTEGGGTGDVLTDRAGALTSNRISSIAGRHVESALGLEEFSVQGNLFNPNQGGGTRLRATKRLSDRVRVTYMSTVGSANEQAIRVEYRWTDHISLQGQTDRQGKAVLNIKYGLRFK